MILSNDKANPAIRLDEKSNVETPLLDQLEGLGWTVISLEQAQTPQQSLRSSFDQVVLLPVLERALRRINPFLADDQVAEVVRRITVAPGSSLIENNQHVLRLLNVWCSGCRSATSITNFRGQVVKGDLVLSGACSMCGGPVRRLIETGD